MKTSEILIAGKAKIATPKTWTKGSYALTASGSPSQAVWGDDPKACKWCSMGALQAVTGYGQNRDSREIVDSYYDAKHFLDAAAQALAGRGNSIVSLNDDSKHAQVMEAWDKAIKLAQEREQ